MLANNGGVLRAMGGSRRNPMAFYGVCLLKCLFWGFIFDSIWDVDANNENYKPQSFQASPARFEQWKSN